MALALANGPHKRVNKIARAVVAELLAGSRRGPRARPNAGQAYFQRKYTTYPGGVSDADVERVTAKYVAMYEKLKNASAAQKAKAAPMLFKRGDGASFGKAAAGGKLRAADPGVRALRSKAKRIASTLLGIPQKSGVGAKAAGLRVKSKKEAYTLPWGATGHRRAVPHKPVGMRASEWYKKIGGKAGYRRLYEATDFGGYRAARVAFRRGSKQFKNRKWVSPIGPGVETLGTSGPYKASGAILTALRGAPAARRRSSGKGGGSKSAVMKRAAALRAQGMSAKQALKQAWARPNVSALQNVSALGGVSALENPDFGGYLQYLQGYALPVVVAGGAAGAVHAFAAKSGVTAKVADLVAKVPVVGEKVADNIPYTLQGLVVGSALAFLAPMIGGEAAKYLALTGGAALVVGGGIDAFNFLQAQAPAAASSEDSSLVPDEDLSGLGLGDLAFAPMGDLAFAPMGDLAFEAQSNPFRGASLSAPMTGGDALAAAYGQSSFADAYYSGADFSAEEGQALLNGEQAWCNAFGNPSRRMAGKKASAASHHAGREGHRWGWLIALVGTQRAQKIAALPPTKRLAVLRKLRSSAVAAYQQAMAAEGHAEAQKAQRIAQAHANTVLPAAGAVANGAMGAMGPGFGSAEYLGDPVVFMGA